MLNFRIAGLSLDCIASTFNCDPKTIRYQCKKYGIRPHYVLERAEKVISPVFMDKQMRRHWLVENGERINMGHSYAEYLEKAHYSPRVRRGFVYD